MEKISNLSDSEEGYPRVVSPATVEQTDWVTYNKNKNKKEKIPEFLEKQLSDPKKVPGKPVPSTNLYDYKGPRDKAKVEDNHGVNENMDTFHTITPLLTGPEGIFEKGYRVRETDPTDPDNDLQYPDISLDTKRASFRVISRYINGFLYKTSANLKEIILKDTHRSHAEKVSDSKKCSVLDVSKPAEKKTGKFTYRVKASDSPNTRTTIFQFLKNGSTETSSLSLLEYPVLMGCSCPSFLWWGAQYYALAGKYMFLPMFRPSNRAPVPEETPSSVSQNGKVNFGRGLNFTVCKHILAAADKLQGIKIESDEAKSYKPKGPRQRVFNPTQWEKSFGVFSFSDILKLQKSGVIPKALISRVKSLENYNEIETFLNDEANGWKSWGDKQKINYVKNLLGHPDLTLYIMLRDYQMTGRQSPLLREKLYDSLDTVMQFNDEEGKIVKEKPELLDEYADEKQHLERILSRGRSKDKEIKSKPEKFVSELIDDMITDKRLDSDEHLKKWFGKDWKTSKDILKKLLTRFK